MIEGRINRRGLVMLGALALLAGCKVIPKGPVVPPPPPEGPTEALPADQQRHRVALLLPMNGPNSGVAQSIANATTMALLDTNAKNLRITTYDTSDGAAAAANKAIADGNKLILGPLQAEDVGPIAAVARAAHVPLIAYTGDAAVASRDTFVMATGPGDSIERTVRHAAKAGVKRFALLAPNGDYGQRAGSAYATAVRAAGGSLVLSQNYERGNTSIVSIAQRMRARGGFDAVLIADGARFAALAAPNLKSGAAAGPRILGTELWNGEGVIGTNPALRGAWFSAVSDGRFRQFSDSYKARFGTAPYRIATLGYDSVLLTIRIARDWRLGAPFPVNRMLDSGGFLGIDGPFRFGPNGVVERSLEVREVRAKGIAVVSPAPDRFAD